MLSLRPGSWGLCSFSVRVASAFRVYAMYVCMYVCDVCVCGYVLLPLLWVVFGSLAPCSASKLGLAISRISELQNFSFPFKHSELRNFTAVATA